MSQTRVTDWRGWNRNRANPRVARARKLSERLGIPPEEVFGRWKDGLHYCQDAGWHKNADCARRRARFRLQQKEKKTP